MGIVASRTHISMQKLANAWCVLLDTASNLGQKLAGLTEERYSQK